MTFFSFVTSLTSPHLTPDQSPKVTAPKPEYLLKKMEQSLNWMKAHDYRYKKDVPVWNRITEDLLPTFSNNGLQVKKDVLEMNPKDFKEVRFVRNPYDVPDIGGKDGSLTKFLQKIPLHRGACYATALTIASKLPEVNIVYGVYQQNNVIRHKHEGLDFQTKHFLKLMKQQQEDRTKARTYGNRDILVNQWFMDSDGYWLFRDKNHAVWTFHAWLEYKGIHFDPWLYRILKERESGTRTWFSKNKKKFIPWQRYRMYKKINLDEYFSQSSKYRNKKQEMRDILVHISLRDTYGKIFEDIGEHIGCYVVNGGGRAAFRFPTQSSWMKHKRYVP